jgi:ubiquinone/menaquinone biosynthesis C-methylase UbiE
VDLHKRYLQQAGWTRELRNYLFGQAGLDKSRKVLEVGCGTGAISAGLTTPGAIHGLDLDHTSLLGMRRNAPNVIPVCGDALSLPYAGGAFDITFCHFLLLWVHDPIKTLQEMKRVTRPGGAVLALAEPDHAARVDEPLELTPLGGWQTEALHQRGADTSLGRHLAEIFHRAGIEIIETGTLRSGDNLMKTRSEFDLEWEVLEADLAGLVPEDELSRLKAIELKAWEKGEWVLNVPTYFAWGRV